MQKKANRSMPLIENEAPISKIKAKTLALNGMRQKRKATPRCSMVKTCGPTSSGGFIFLPFGFCSRTIQY